MTSANSKLGQYLSGFIGSFQNYWDPEAMALITRAAASSPTPATAEVCYTLCGGWTGTGMTMPAPNPTFSFPADHGEHFDTSIEWRYITLSTTLADGTIFSLIANFFRKAIANATTAPGVDPLDRQIYSTSIACTIQAPGKAPAHWAFPNTTFAPVEGGVTIENAPFKMVIGANSLSGTSDVFPLTVHIEGPADAATGRPAIAVDVVCAATNPFFLQGQNGYVGAATDSPVAWYYYSWPQQAVTGTVSIAGVSQTVSSGIAWLDHQWGGFAAPATAAKPGWSGWCWFEFQFDGDRSLTLASPHGGIVGQRLPLINVGFGTYVEGATAKLSATALEVGAYTKSPNSGAYYPSDWTIEVKSVDNSVILLVKPKTVLADQTMGMAQLTEYTEAAATVTAIGMVNGLPVEMSGVGYCEGVGFEDPDAVNARCKTWLRAVLDPAGAGH